MRDARLHGDHAAVFKARDTRPARARYGGRMLSIKKLLALVFAMFNDNLYFISLKNKRYQLLLL
jgi:hypothetical protein